jgi:hypothetical protein
MRTILPLGSAVLLAATLTGAAAGQFLQPTSAERAVRVQLAMYDSFWREFDSRDEAQNSSELTPFDASAEADMATIYQFCDGWSEQFSELDERGLVAQMSCYGDGADYDRGEGQADAISSSTLDVGFVAPMPVRVRIHALFHAALDADLGNSTIDMLLTSTRGERYQLVLSADVDGEVEWRSWVAAGPVQLNAALYAEVFASRWLDSFDPPEWTENWLELELRSFCPGDFNCDEAVDGADAAEYRAAWLASDSAADVNDDGLVDQLDADLFRRAYRLGCE